MRLILVGPGRIGRALAPLLTADGHEVTTLTRRDYGEFASRDYNPETAVAGLSACDAVLLLAGRFELAAPEATERLATINHAAPVWFAEAVHARFPQAQIITFLDSRVNRPPEALPEAIRPYMEGKRRLRDWTLKAALAWGRESGARVNAIAPGPVLPPPDPKHSEKAGALLTPRPTVEDILRALRFLLLTPSVTGQILYVTGGQHLL